MTQVTVTRHPGFDKELVKLPKQIRVKIDIAIAKLAIDPTDPTVVHKSEVGWKGRRVYVADFRFQATYRLAWEVVPGDGDKVTVVLWMAAAHEGFYARLAQRAKQ